MVNDPNRVSDLSITYGAPLVLGDTSEDAYDIDPKFIRSSTPKKNLNGAFSYNPYDIGNVGDPGDPVLKDRPQPDDIASITKTLYTLAGKTRVKIVIKIKNNSGDILSDTGFDAIRSQGTA
jgi:hypothetical protein